MRTIGPDLYAKLPHPQHYGGRLVGGGIASFAIPDELDAEEQPRATHVADRQVSGVQLSQSRQQMVPDPKRVRLKTLLPRHPEGGQARGASGGAAAERAEELHAVVEAL